MFNRERTKEEFGYDLDLSIRRRTNEEFESTGNTNKKKLMVIDNCPECGNERKIRLRASRKNKPCSKCFHNSPEMIEIKKNSTHIVSDETKQKMKENHWSTKGGISWIKGKHQSDKTKNKLSKAIKTWHGNASKEEIELRAKKATCTLQGKTLEEFDGWLTPKHKQLRNTPEYQNFEKIVIDRDKKCQYLSCLEARKDVLTVHHKDGFHWCEERRNDPTNGVLLCHKHHNEFHDTHGRQNNTEAQYNKWIEEAKLAYNAPVKLIILNAPSGAGKTWIANQLNEEYSYVPFDKTPKEQHLFKIMQVAKTSEKPIIYDPFRKGGTLYRRYKDIWPCKLITITESVETITERIKGRGGKPDLKKIAKAVKNNAITAKRSHFSGTSTEVLEYLKNLKF